MPTLGVSELLVIFMILVLVFGASRLPALGEGLGRTLRNFKRGLASDSKIEVKSDSGSLQARPTAGGASGPSVASASKDGQLAVTDAEIVDEKR